MDTTSMKLKEMNLTYGVTDTCPTRIPSSAEYLNDISSSDEKIAIMSVFGSMSAVTLGIYLYEIILIIRNKISVLRRIRTVMLLSLYPVYSLLSLLSVLVPRAAPLLDLVSNTFFSVTLWHFIQLIMLYYGGEKRMREVLQNEPISLRVPPVCCLCCCLNPVKMTEQTTLKLKLAAGQFLVLRPILLVISVILFVEDQIDYAAPVQGQQAFPSMFIQAFSIATTLIAMYALIILFRASLKHLLPYKLKGKFVVFQLVMIFGSLQDTVLNVLANVGVIKCSVFLPRKAYALEIHHLALILEMMVLSLGALLVYWQFLQTNISTYSTEEQTAEEGARDNGGLSISQEDGYQAAVHPASLGFIGLQNTPNTNSSNQLIQV